jgi:anti-sigma regulatory factor (Ser/Thr protein kinase)
MERQMNSKASGATAPISHTFLVPGNDFTRAGEAAGKVKAVLKQLGYDSDAIRRVSVAMYEGEINMVIHAGGGTAQVDIYPDRVEILLSDQGPGILDVELAMREGYSTAPDEIRSLGFGAGMGLPNMRRYADEMYVNSVIGSGTDVEMVVKARRADS